MAEKKKIVMLLSNPFRPDPRVHREAMSLVKAGYEVTILCWDREQRYPKEEVIDGILVKRLGPASSFENTKAFLKTLPRFWKLARREMASIDIDIIHAHDLDTLSPAVKEAKKRHIPLIYDSHEIYHEMASERLGRFAVSVIKFYEIRMVKKPDAVLCVNDRFRDILGSWGARRPTVIMGCPPAPEAPAAKVEKIKQETSPDGKPIVLYIGVLEPNRNLMEMVNGFAAGRSLGARLLLGGYGTLESSIASIKSPHIRFIGPVKPADMPAYILAAHILVAIYNPAFGNNRDSVPNKLFEAMSASKPIIVAKDTWTAKTVERTGCGISVTYGTNEVFDAINNLLVDSKQYGKCASHCRKSFTDEYNWSVMESRLLALYSGFSVTDD